LSCPAEPFVEIDLISGSSAKWRDKVMK
jgi:hypothetical protein